MKNAAYACAGQTRRHISSDFRNGDLESRCFWCGLPIRRDAINNSWWYTFPSTESWLAASEGPSGLIPAEASSPNDAPASGPLEVIREEDAGNE